MKQRIMEILEGYVENGTFPDDSKARLIYEENFKELAEEITEYIQKALNSK